MGSIGADSKKFNKKLRGYKELNLSKCTKSEIREQFLTIFETNEALFNSLKDDSFYYKMPDRLRLPLIFYFGHTAAVFMNKMVLGGLVEPEKRPNLGYETLFETGVDEFSWDDLENYRFGGSFLWPSVKAVIEYRNEVKQIILQCIETLPLELPITTESPWWAVLMGISHEAIHIETSSVLIRQMPVDMVTNPGLVYGPIKSGESVVTNEMIKCDATDVYFGKSWNNPKYDWDCSYGNTTCRVETFEASQYLITNREFLEFVKDNGYQKKEYWGEEGWQWCQFKQAKHPTFWVCEQGCKNGSGGDLATGTHCQIPSFSSKMVGEGCQCPSGANHGVCCFTKFRLRVMFDEISLPLDWPVEVNFHEAKAYCAWRGPEYRLPIEAERHVMIGENKTKDAEFLVDVQANVNLKHGSSTPVNMYPPSSRGFYDLHGNVWEWYEDSFNGFPGYKTHYLYDDYSSVTFDGKQNLIVGGSWISLVDQGGEHCRNGFRRHFFQHAGFRVARNVDVKQFPVDLPVVVVAESEDEDNINLDQEMYNINLQKSSNQQFFYETEEQLHKKLRSEYLGDGELLSVRLVEQAVDIVHQGKTNIERALYIGCATGRGALSLLTTVDEILAIDFSAAFIEAAEKLQSDGNLVLKDLPEISFPMAKDTKDRLTFRQFNWLPNEVGTFDFIYFCDIDRFNMPKGWLARFNEICRPDGLVAIVTTEKNDMETLGSYLGHERFKIIEEGKQGLVMWQKK